MAEGGAYQPGYAFFFVIAEDEANFTNAEHADLDYFQSIFKTNLGLKWMNEDLFVRNLTPERWNHKWKHTDKENQAVSSENCCILCYMKKLDYSSVEYLMIGISSHGTQMFVKDIVNLYNGTTVYVEDIMNTLNDESFPALQGKKRLLVFDKCRRRTDEKTICIDNRLKFCVQSLLSYRRTSEEARDDGKEIEEPVDDEEGFGFSNTQPFDDFPLPGPIGPTVEGQEIEMPLARLRVSDTFIKTQPMDFLVIYGTTPGRLAYSNKGYGSFMLQCLNDAIIEHSSERPLNLYHVLTKTAQKISKRKSKQGYKVVSCTSSTLRELPIFYIANSDQTLPTNVPFT